jgi:hypothetical protein
MAAMSFITVYAITLVMNLTAFPRKFCHSITTNQRRSFVVRTLELSKSTIETLMISPENKYITLYMPVHSTTAPANAKQDSTRLNSLLHRLKTKIYPSDTKLTSRLAELKDLVDDLDFWYARTGNGLAVLVDSNEITIIDLTYEVPELLFIDDDYVLGPMIMQIDPSVEAPFVLLLNRTAPKLYQFAHPKLIDIAANMPEDLETALRIDEYRQRQQHHVGDGSGRAQYHGHGGSDKRETDIKNYLQIIKERTEAALAGKSSPLILVGTPKNIGYYRSISEYHNLYDEDVRGNFEHRNQEALWAALIPVVDTIEQAELLGALDSFQELSGSQPDRVSTDLKAILAAAKTGRVKELLVGIRDLSRDSVQTHLHSTLIDRFKSGAEGLQLSRAVVAAWLSGGTVRTMPSSLMPDEAPIAAMMRY